jgi:hypothetical protein
VVKLRYFAGMEHAEIAELLGISTITVKRHWRYALAWLLRSIEGSSPSDCPHLGSPGSAVPKPEEQNSEIA